MKKLLEAGILLLFSIQALAFECTGTVTSIDTDSTSCNGFASYTNSENPDYWICSDSQKSDDLLMLAYSMQRLVKTKINGAGTCGAIAQHYLVGYAVAITFDTFPITTYEVGYLVVGGGGSGGDGSTDGFYWATQGGGGGAGGVRTGTKTLDPGVTYSVTIGAGGSTVLWANGNKGGDSSFDDITATGGGYGGFGGQVGVPGSSGGPGGSGGGGGSGDCYMLIQPGGSGGSGDSPDVTPDQGFDGGSYACPPLAGGGGGAGSTGQAGNNTGGGSGVAWEGQVTFAVGGNAGGGSPKFAGAANTGDGGDGGLSAFSSVYAPKNGGSGVVILKIPVDKYSGVTTGSPTVTEAGGYKFVKFTASGSYSG